MKIAVSSSGKTLTSQVDPRFGRCQYFLLVDSDTLEYEAILNNAVSSTHGAGVAAATIITSKGVDVVLTGNIGPNAFEALSISGIKVVTGVEGIAEDSVKRFLSDEFKPTETPTVRGHFGQGGRGQAMHRRRR